MLKRVTQPNFITMTEISCKYPHEKVQNVLTLVLTIQNLPNGLVTFRGPHKRDQTKTITLIKPLNTSQDDAADLPKSATPNQQGDKSLQVSVSHSPTLTTSRPCRRESRERARAGGPTTGREQVLSLGALVYGRPGRRTPMST